MTYKSPTTDKELADYFYFRWKILRKPLNLPLGSEQDDLEDRAHHIAAYNGTKIIGAGRLHLESDEYARIRYMAIHKDHQNKGIGSNILYKLEHIAKTNDVEICWLYAREGITTFYKKNGYKTNSTARINLHGLVHVRMEKNMRRRPKNMTKTTKVN